MAPVCVLPYTEPVAVPMVQVFAWKYFELVRSGNYSSIEPMSREGEEPDNVTMVDPGETGPIGKARLVRANVAVQIWEAELNMSGARYDPLPANCFAAWFVFPALHPEQDTDDRLDERTMFRGDAIDIPEVYTIVPVQHEGQVRRHVEVREIRFAANRKGEVKVGYGVARLMR